MTRNTKDAIEHILKQKERDLKTLAETRQKKREEQKKINALQTRKNNCETAYKSQNFFKKLWTYRQHQKDLKSFDAQIQVINYNIQNFIDPVIESCQNSISRSEKYIRHLKNIKTGLDSKSRKPGRIKEKQKTSWVRDNSLEGYHTLQLQMLQTLQI